jgi:hypothetical protein
VLTGYTKGEECETLKITVMSKMQNNPIIQKAKGMFVNTIVYRAVRGKMIMAHRPKATEKTATAAQDDVRIKFRSAAAFCIYFEREILVMSEWGMMPVIISPNFNRFNSET